MNRLAAVPATAVALALLLAACGPSQSGSLGTLPTDQPAATPSPTQAPTAGLGSPSPAATPGRPRATSPAPPTRTLTIEVWFTRDGTLFPTTRTRPATQATSGLALAELSFGPSTEERAVGVRSGMPTELSYAVSISDGIATVDLPASFYAGGRDAARLSQAQVVYTLTQFPTVSKVGFRAGGEPAGAPVGRADYDDLLPLVVVTSPTIGQRVTSPVTVAGTANVYEATVSVRILDASGAEIATTFTNHTCGGGCRGDYSVAVPYRVPAEQPGTVQVYQVSAEDGSRVDVVDIPVTLAASR